MTFAHGETVTVLTPGTVYDEYADENVPSWEVPATETEVANVLVGSGGSTEPLEVARNEVASDFDLIFQPPVTVTPTAQDRIVVRGLTCDVVGRPFRWVYPGSGTDAGLVVRCSIREG